MLSRVISGAVLGVDAYRVDVEVDIARSLPSFAVVGLPDNAVKESKDRVKAAIRNSGYPFPTQRVTVNLAPADVKKEGAAFDLPMAVAILASDSSIGLRGLGSTLFLGELSLDGAVRPVRGVLPIALEARRAGLKALCVPRDNTTEAAVVKDIEVLPADSLAQVVEGLRGGRLDKFEVDLDALFRARHEYDVDFGEVRGQVHLKRALEIAAAGGHTGGAICRERAAHQRPDDLGCSPQALQTRLGGTGPLGACGRPVGPFGGAYTRALKVASTIADLAAAPEIERAHVL